MMQATPPKETTMASFRNIDKAITDALRDYPTVQWLRPLIHKCDERHQVYALSTRFGLPRSLSIALEVVAEYFPDANRPSLR